MYWPTIRTVLWWGQVVMQGQFGFEVLTEEKADQHCRAQSDLQGVWIPPKACLWVSSGYLGNSWAWETLRPPVVQRGEHMVNCFLGRLCTLSCCLLTWSPNPSGKQLQNQRGSSQSLLLGTPLKREAAWTSLTEAGLAQPEMSWIPDDGSHRPARGAHRCSQGSFPRRVDTACLRPELLPLRSLDPE